MNLPSCCVAKLSSSKRFVAVRYAGSNDMERWVSLSIIVEPGLRGQYILCSKKKRRSTSRRAGRQWDCTLAGGRVPGRSERRANSRWQRNPRSGTSWALAQRAAMFLVASLPNAIASERESWRRLVRPRVLLLCWVELNSSDWTIELTQPCHVTQTICWQGIQANSLIVRVRVIIPRPIGGTS